MSGLLQSYERLERKLASADIESSGAEVHGILCGLLCSGNTDTRAIWLAELLPEKVSQDLLAQECEQALDTIYKTTHDAITGPGVGFTPLLPEDNKPFRQRATGVIDWCQGFLYGIGLAGIQAEQQLSAETQEALRDFAEITRMDLDSLEGSEADEDALVEVTEFLWVAAMLVQADMVKDPTERG